jgi:hypothetical protein
MSSKEAGCGTNVLLLVEDWFQLWKSMVMIVLNLFGIFDSSSTGYDIF